ncbi:nuclear transport factor 2 family protein [Amycolatopsis sp. NPDC004368]
MDAVFEKYFGISDAAVAGQRSPQELLTVFTPDAVVSTGSGEVYRGTAQIEGFFTALLSRNDKLHHAWTPEQTSADGSVSTRWGVVGLRKTGEIFTAQGTDVAQLDATGLIRRLDIHFD